MIALADQCMADYDDNGWTGHTWSQMDDWAAAILGTGRAALRSARSVGLAPAEGIPTLPP